MTYRTMNIERSHRSPVQSVVPKFYLRSVQRSVQKISSRSVQRSGKGERRSLMRCLQAPLNHLATRVKTCHELLDYAKFLPQDLPKLSKQ